MSDDIFIKHGLGAFQQPYIGRASVNAQEPIISQRDARTPGNARQPGTYQHRTQEHISFLQALKLHL